MTLGEYRVGISFNPSNNGAVDDIKKAAAALIDLCVHYRTVQESADPEVLRLWALAMTETESAAMWAVKAATKKPL